VSLSPTWSLLLFVLAVALFAYEVVYPRVVGSSARRLIVADLVLTIAVLTVVGMTYWNSGTAFSLGLFDTNWAVATILYFVLFESILMTRYCRKFGIDLSDFGKGGS
jgi:hypothetical protein